MYIKNGDQCIALDVSLKFGNVNKNKIKYSEPKDYLGRLGKGLIASLGLNTIIRLKKIKKARFSITEVSIKDLSNIIKNFKDFTYEGYLRERSNTNAY